MDQRDRILPPYTRRVDDTQHKIVRLIGIASLILFSMVLGFFIGVFGLYGWFIPAIPLVILALVALWMAPDVDTRLDGAIERAYFIFWGLALVWPSYIAFNIPGLPWVSFSRLAMLVTALISLTAISMSPRIRSDMVVVLTYNKPLFRLFLAWVSIHALMLLVGRMESTGRWVQHALTWHLLFVISAWIMLKPGNALRLNRIILIAAAITGLFAIAEYAQEKPIWADHIPSFLGIDPELQEMLQFGVVRTAEYRVRSIFVVSLGYAEYIGMLLPFAVLILVTKRPLWKKGGALLLVTLLGTAAFMTQARSAMVALLAGVVLMLALWACRQFWRNKEAQDVLSAGVFYGFPVAAIAVVMAALSIHRVRVRLLGGDQHQFSDNAREAQWDMAVPEILTNPLGHGMGSIDRVVPYTNLAGKFTIDSYPINLLVEYGILGFLTFVGFFITAVYLGIRTFIIAEGPEEELAGAAAVGIASFLVTRTILSSEGGQYIAFGFAGLIAALRYRQHIRVGSRGRNSAQLAEPRSTATTATIV